MMRRTDDTLRVVDNRGVTVQERPAGVKPRETEQAAVSLAIQRGGKVFRIDRDGFLDRVYPVR